MGINTFGAYEEQVVILEGRECAVELFEEQSEEQHVPVFAAGADPRLLCSSEQSSCELLRFRRSWTFKGFHLRTCKAVFLQLKRLLVIII